MVVQTDLDLVEEVMVEAVLVTVVGKMAPLKMEEQMEHCSKREVVLVVQGLMMEVQKVTQLMTGVQHQTVQER